MIALRLPVDLARDRKWLLSIREDTRRRLDEIKALKLPDGPLPRRIWCMTGFRSNGQFYTDPAIARMDFEITRLLGMNGFWEQNGGQPGELRKLAAAQGIERSTVYWRSVETPPRDAKLGGAVPLNWDSLEQYIARSYADGVTQTRTAHPFGMPTIIADLMDEPAGQGFEGAEYQQEFRAFLGRRVVAGVLRQAILGRGSLAAAQLAGVFQDPRQVVGKSRTDNPSSRIYSHRLFYWASVFWNHSTARLYALATRKVEELAPGVGTRVNFGPPWWYDYGTLPRGIDAFEFGKLRGVSLGFNEDWCGNGNPRVPMELNTLLMDWSRGRAAGRVAAGLLHHAGREPYGSQAADIRLPGPRGEDLRLLLLRPVLYLLRSLGRQPPHGPGRGRTDPRSGAGRRDPGRWPGAAAQVALLYSRSWPVWKDDDTEQCEQMMVYLALLHAGLPVDIVSDEELADGRFAARAYKCLYVVNESLPVAAAAAVEQWVRSGGRLWCSGWAAMRDEYNTPTDAWTALLGAQARSWKAVGDLKRLGEPIKVDDWRRPIFVRETTITRKLPSTQPYQTACGAGLVCVAPRTVGKDYMDGRARGGGKTGQGDRLSGRRAAGGDYRAGGTGRRAAAGEHIGQPDSCLAFVDAAQGRRAAREFQRRAGGENDSAVPRPRPVSKLRSLRQGKLTFTAKGQGEFELTMPMSEVTDVLVVE